MAPKLDALLREDRARCLEPGFLKVSPPPGLPLAQLLARIESLGTLDERGEVTSFLIDMR